jgi:hypothetical protein
MKKNILKLYRGVIAEDFFLLSPKQKTFRKRIWKEILLKRINKNYEYPENLDKEIQRLLEITRIERQHFTDKKKIAASYAKKSNGILIEISVPLSDLLKKFRLEFQNFGKRKSQFEIVYVVHSDDLLRSSKRWKLKANRI